MKTSVRMAHKCYDTCWPVPLGLKRRTEQQALITQWEIKSSKVRPNMHRYQRLVRERIKGT